MPNLFRVLIIDDKLSVLNAMKDWIEHEYDIAGEKYTIELNLLQVKVCEANGLYNIDSTTYENLGAFCNKSFDLILSDFGFVKEGTKVTNEVERIKEANKDIPTREIIDKIVLNPSSLVTESQNYTKTYNKIKKNFIEFKGNFYIFTYIPSKLEREYTSADVRRNVTNKHFPRANLLLIDSRKELFNNSKFDNKHDEEFYPFIIAKYLSKIIQLEIAKDIIKKTADVRKRAATIKRNNRIVSTSVVIPSIISGVFIPSLFESIGKGNYLIGIAFLIMLVMVVSILTILPTLLENNNKKMNA